MARNLDPDATRAAGASNATAAVERSDENGRYPDYKSDTYRAQMALWAMCSDAKEGTEAYRRSAAKYLPRMKSESPQDYAARIAMTFATDHYATTLDDLVGLAFAKDPTVSETVPEPLRALLENMDGRGSSFPVLARRAFSESLDDGHVVLYTDYPQVSDPSRLTLQDVKARKIRPFVSVREAQDVLSHRTIVLGGEEVLVQIVFRECATVAMGDFGTTEEYRYRVVKQEVITEPNPETGEDMPVALGAMGWELWKKVTKSGRRGGTSWAMSASGSIVGPERLPVRIAYGGTELGTLHSRPFLASLSYVMHEEVQVKSEYANVMHKCNVPTPVFVGRQQQQKDQPIVMGEGLDIPIGGNAFIMEPGGTAITATRERLQDLGTEAQRKGATMNATDAGGTLTATEAAIVARQRNARLAVAVQSSKDAWEGVFADMAAFLEVQLPKSESGAKGGGAVVFDTSFGANAYDAAFVAECREAWKEGALPMEAYLHVLKTGKLPDDFDPETVAALQEAARAAAQDAERAAAAAALADANGGQQPQDGQGAPPPQDGQQKQPLPGDKAGARAGQRSAGV